MPRFDSSWAWFRQKGCLAEFTDAELREGLEVVLTRLHSCPRDYAHIETTMFAAIDGEIKRRINQIEETENRRISEQSLKIAKTQANHSARFAKFAIVATIISALINAGATYYASKASEGVSSTVQSYLNTLMFEHAKANPLPSVPAMTSPSKKN